MVVFVSIADLLDELLEAGRRCGSPADAEAKGDDDDDDEEGDMEDPEGHRVKRACKWGSCFGLFLNSILYTIAQTPIT